MTGVAHAAGDGAPPGAGVQSQNAVSPYSTGGGGVTLERRVGASYLALLLTGDGAPELGDGRTILSVAFQQAPRVPVDDLVILAARPDEMHPSLELAVGIRRAPNIVPSDARAQKLIVEYIRTLLRAPADGRERRLALIVAGPQKHAEQLAELAALAIDQMDAPSFFALVQTPGKFRQALVNRLRCLAELVAAGLPILGVGDADDELVHLRTWELLSSLSILMPRVEEPDLGDWVGTRNRLAAVARGNDLVGAGHLLDRLETVAARSAPHAATVDLRLLRREVHSLLESGRWRHQQGWAAIGHLQAQAENAVRDRIGLGDHEGILHVDRDADGAALVVAAKDAAGLVVHGESGVGKSALVLRAATAAAVAAPDELQVVCLNLRHLPEASLEFVASLGCSLEALLGELSAPHRLLVVDGADAATETRDDMFAYLVNAARASSVGVVAVTASGGRQVVRDLLAAQLAEEITEHHIPGLNDAQLGDIVASFPELARLAGNARSRELLRRLVVVDLLVRSNMSGLPLSDVDAMREIWTGLVRRHERHDRGLPDAREQVLLRLAARDLSGGPAVELVASLDAGAVDGLRQDGILRASTGTPWQVVPDFAHDEMRRYALARVLLVSGDPAAQLLAAGAPRWALGAGRLACQAWLDAGDQASGPLLGSAQAAFDALVAAGYGARWGDVPGEALLTLGDPQPLLAGAWPELRDGDAAGLRRLLRLVDQRHRNANAIVDAAVLEPIVALLLNEAAPWRIDAHIATSLRDWLLALVVEDVVGGHPVRLRLRERLVAAAAAGDRRLAEQQQATVAARATRTAEEIEKEREVEAQHRVLLTTMGYGARTHRKRAQLPRELTDDTALELLALLGPDMGEAGEQLLRRVAQDDPRHLAPALEEPLTGRALAGYGRGLLADLTEAYYLDEEEDGSGFHEDGIRRHHWRGPIAPLAAWYRGPFAALFQSDPRRGMAVLNRLLNHAALARARTLAALGNPWRRVSEDAVDQFRTELEVSGVSRSYVGDSHVWVWYRGSGVGPAPCLSALQALERFCDQLIVADVPIERLVGILLDGCENLAMLGLVVGVLVRHLERAGTALDPFLAEPVIWGLEFARVVSDSSGLAASSDGLVAPERRSWSFREVAMWLAVHADSDRADELRSIGARMVAAAERIDASPHTGEDHVSDAGDAQRVSYTTKVRNWASALDRDRYRTYTEEGITYIEGVPPADVQAALQPGNEDLQRGQESLRLLSRYVMQPRTQQDAPIGAEELVIDLRTAKELLDDPPVAGPTGRWDAPAAVAASALEAHLLVGMHLPADTVQIAVNTILAFLEGPDLPDQAEFEGSYFQQGADRSAARALPLLLLPAATPLCEACGEEGGMPGEARVAGAARRVARAVSYETRLHLARGLDPVWRTPCQSTPCHHELALDLAVESMRDCVLGGWDNASQQRHIVLVDDPVAESLAAVASDTVFVSRLDAAIRSLGVAAVCSSCVRGQAQELLMTMLDAQRRGLLAHKHDLDDRGSHALVAARALLGLAAAGDDAPLHEHIAAYADNGTLLGSLLRALAAAAEETSAAAQAARRIWPDIITRVLELNRAGHDPFSDGYFGQAALAALIPTPTYDGSFLYREVEAAPLAWPDPLAWRPAVDAWLVVAAGRPRCLDSLVGLVQTLSPAEQATIGLPWVATVVLADVNAIVDRSHLLAEWLTAIRSPAADAGALGSWQQVVDALVVAGDTNLAPYSE